MSGNRPRPSIINLFDPLANATTSEPPSTPPPRASNADSGNYNNSPNGLTMTLFVNKITSTILHPQPTPLKRRLIDIGDMTLEDAACPEALLDETVEEEFSTGFDQVGDDEDNATLTFKDMVKAATPYRTLKTVLESPTNQASPMPRLPPVNITLDNAQPIPRLNTREEGIVPEQPSEEPIPEEEAALGELAPQRAGTPEMTTQDFVSPEDIPLPLSPIMDTQELTVDSVLDCISDTGLSFSEVHPDLDHSITTTDKPGFQRFDKPTPTGHNDSPDAPDISIPSLNLVETSEVPRGDTSIPVVVSQSSPTSSPLPLPEPRPEFDKGGSPAARLRLSRPITSQDKNRVSVDLHASFQMHMQSEGMSFDLLSDNVSFLNAQSGMESSLTTIGSTIEDDPSFDLETERINMEKALGKYPGNGEKEEKASLMDDTSSATSSPAPATPVDVPSTPSTSAYDTGDPRSTLSSDLKFIRKRLSIPIAVSSPRLMDVSSPPSVGASPLPKWPSSPFSPPNGSKLRAPTSRSPVASIGSVFSVPTSAEKRRHTLQLTTPKTSKEQKIPTMPQAPPALKIVKRSKPSSHERNESTSSRSGTCNGTGLKRASMPLIPSKTLDLPTIVPLRTRKVATELGSLRVTEPEAQPIQQLAKTKSSVPPRPPVPPTQTNGSGPRRVPISEGSQLKVTAPRAVTMPASSKAGSRRVNPPSIPAPQARLAANFTSSGLQAPTQLGNVTISSLPKPISRTSGLISRLPAPRNFKPGGLAALRRAT